MSFSVHSLGKDDLVNDYMFGQIFVRKYGLIMSYTSLETENDGTKYSTSVQINSPDPPESEVLTVVMMSVMMLSLILFFLRLLGIKKKRIVKEHNLYCTLERNLGDQANDFDGSHVKERAKIQAQLELKNFTSMKLDMSTTRAF